MSALVVVRCGPLVTVQDRGRRGHARHGIPPSGPLDRELFARALAAVGGREDDAAIEVPLHTALFRVEGAALVSIDGEPPRALRDETFEVPSSGVATRYLAVRGGIDVPVVLGARATFVNAGFGGFEGRPLRAGDRLPIGAASLADRTPPDPPPQRLSTDEPLRLVPTFDAAPEALAALLATRLRVDPRSDRVGTRLAPEAPLPVPRETSERLSRPVVPGALQLPPDGRPIVLGPDGPTTGGYALLGVLDGPSRSRLARRRPGEFVRFRTA